jgi:hypothetical protein
MTMGPFHNAISTHKLPKIQIKNAAVVFPTGCVYSKFYQIFTANHRLPAGIIPAGHHQLLVFRLGGSSILRLICFILLILNQLS